MAAAALSSNQLDPITDQESLKEKYETHFDPDAYLTTMYQKPSDHHTGDYMKFVVSSLHRIFSIEVPEGESVLDLGCGPAIHTVISASGHYKNIVSGDFLEGNRQVVKKWLENDLQTFDWTYVFKMVANLENEAKLEARLRGRIKEVIPCDVTLQNPIAPLRRTFDVIVTSICYEAVATDHDIYKKLVANTTNLMQPNGYLIVAGVFKGSYYTVGSTRFQSFALDKKSVDEAMTAAGLDVLLWLIQPRNMADRYNKNCTEYYAVLARKRN